MKRRFTEEQIIGFVREADAGLPVKELCRKHGFREPNYYAWKAKIVGMEVSDAQRLRALEAEKGKLKRLLANSMPTVTRSAQGISITPERVQGFLHAVPFVRRGRANRYAQATPQPKLAVTSFATSCCQLASGRTGLAVGSLAGPATNRSKAGSRTSAAAWAGVPASHRSTSSGSMVTTERLSCWLAASFGSGLCIRLINGCASALTVSMV